MFLKNNDDNLKEILLPYDNQQYIFFKHNHVPMFFNLSANI